MLQTTGQAFNITQHQPGYLPDSRCHTWLVKAVERLIAARSRRSQFFDSELFADPAWDMLLQLYSAKLTQRRISISGLCDGSGVPPTTGLRWLQRLVDMGLAEKTGDPLDQRRVWVALSEAGTTAMDNYFDDQLTRQFGECLQLG